MAVSLLVLVLAGAVFVVAWLTPHAVPQISEIRIRNDTGFPLHHVVVNGQPYGDIGVGDTTGYQRLRKAYRYARVSAITDMREMRLEPDDYVGEARLGRGRFTYVLRIIDTEWL